MIISYQYPDFLNEDDGELDFDSDLFSESNLFSQSSDMPSLIELGIHPNRLIGPTNNARFPTLFSD